MCSYYKYQNVRSAEEYEEIVNKRMKIEAELAKNQMRVKEIPIFRDCEFDIDRLNKNYDNIVNHIFKKEHEVKNDYSVLKSTLSKYMRSSHASYLAPAYNYNCYLELLIENNITNYNREQDERSGYIDYLYTIHIHNIFISIKSLLDRMLSIFSYYYGGISLDTTFGHISEKDNKGTGFMAIVVTWKEKNDPLMQFIFDEYQHWIKTIVEPRNVIMHYNDMSSEYIYPADGREFPMHYSFRIFGKKEEDRNYDPGDGHYYKSLMKSVQKVYYFFDVIMENLKNRNILYRKPHFINDGEFENYKNSGFHFNERKIIKYKFSDIEEQQVTDFFNMLKSDQ